MATNGSRSVIVHESQEHQVMPYYPHTDAQSILHFIYQRNSPWPHEFESLDLKAAKQIARDQLTRAMTQVSIC